jgi:hypothetical protein
MLMVSQKVKNRVILAPHDVRDELQHESSRFKPLWIPAFAGMTIKGHCGLFPHSVFDVGRSMFDVL